MKNAGRLFWLALLRLVCVAGAFGAIGALVGGAALGWASACAVLLIGFGYHAWKLGELYRWLSSADPASIHPSQVPDGAGTWGEALTQLYRLLRQQRAAEQGLTDSLARFQQAAAALPDGVVMLDQGFNLVWCNPTAETHWQISLARDRTQTITYFIRAPEFQPYLAQRNFNEPLTLRLARAQLGGRMAESTFSVQLVPFGEEQLLLLSRDVSEREKLEAMRRDFVANVSHELRTPLTVLSGFVETLIDAPQMSGEQSKRALRHMESQAARMRRLVDDLLTLSRLEDSQNRLIETQVQLRPLVAAVVSDAIDLSRGRHTISLTEVDAVVSGSADELQSALSNLVTNAVRYTPVGGRIEVVCVSEDDGGVSIEVADNGEGIDPSHLPRLTERFYRVDRGRSRENGGTGLGLAIVKHVVMRHGAALSIESEQRGENHGSKFRIRFPASRLISANSPLPAPAPS